MSQTSHLSRYRPAVLAITGAAAACGIYILYTTFSGQPAKGGLQRSNAVHRRRQRPFSIEYAPADEGALLGMVVIIKGESKLLTDVNTVGAPTASRVRAQFPDVPEDLITQHRLDGAAVESIMNACFLAQSNEQRQAQLRESGVGGISEAMQARDIARVLALATPLVSEILNTNGATIQSATLNFLRTVGLLQHVHPDDRAVAEEQPSANTNATNSDIAETEELSGFEDDTHEPEQGLKGLLYHIAETDATRKAYEHRGITCEGCGEKPVRGVRWHCLNCPDYDLCSTCEAGVAHQKTHVFVKIKIPLPVLSQPTQVHPLWYPGEPRKIYHALPPEMKTYFRQTHDFDEPHIDAYFDQFTSIANVTWKEDPALVKAAIDRRAFNRALTCERWPNRFRPNALYDRMFAFYDTDGNNLIGFGEFLNGIAYLRGPKRFTPLRRALQGFDINGDGYVDRRDFLRLLRAKYETQKLVVNDMVEGQELEQSQAALETLQSSQPISSIFSWEEIPQGEERAPVGKVRDANGDLQPLQGTKVILDDNDGWQAEQAQRQRHLPGESHEQLRHHLSRFEEMLNDSADGAVGQVDVSSMNGAARDGPDRVKKSTADAPLGEDIIWQITEDGFNEILDPIFKAKEEEHRQVIDARPEVERWRDAIEEAVKKKEELKKALQEEFEAAETRDPLLETAMNSLNGSVRVKPKNDTATPATAAFKGDILPTDHESLTRREEEIAQKPLEELLDESGYSTVKDSGDYKPTADAANGHAISDDSDAESSVGSPDSELDRILGLDGTTQPSPTSANISPDPTMPQNRPNSSIPDSHVHSNGTNMHGQPDQPAASSSRKKPELPPSQERLEYLGNLAVVDREIKARGGPGRLSFDEVEAIVRNDVSKELRGIVTGWLEWASF